MKILLTNDDGYQAPGILTLAKAACARGHKVTVVAPLTGQSGKSQSFTLSKPLFLKDYSSDRIPFRYYSIEGTPADCARIGLEMICEEPQDIIISGINYGWNLGIAVYYSGTFAAAREGAFHHIPSIAVSAHETASEQMLYECAERTLDMAEKYALMPKKHNTVLNMNYPRILASEWKETVFAPLSEAFFADSYIAYDSPRAGRCFFMMAGCETEPIEPGSDWDLVEKGHPVLTIVKGYEILMNKEYAGLL